MSGIYAKLGNVQQELHAPKGQTNSFGGYQYRSAEDILEAVKPVLASHGLTLVVTDSIELVGDRVYVHARATVYDVASGGDVSASGWAREPATKKGMDDSQITGATSSYSRKYALNGLFAIDDAKDADTDEHRRQSDNAPKVKKSEPADTGVEWARQGAVSALKKSQVPKEALAELLAGFDRPEWTGLSLVDDRQALGEITDWALNYGKK